MTQTTEDAKKAKAEAIKARSAEMEAREKVLNASRTGKGTRVSLGMTRGKNPVEVQFENWDETQPDTLPVEFKECMDVLEARGITDSRQQQLEMVRRFILGDNEILYTEASDPVAEFMEPNWSDDIKKNFRMVVKNYATGAFVSIEDAVNIIKPGIVAGLAKSGK